MSEMASQQPGAMWAEPMELILPSGDGRPETSRQCPLRECALLIAETLLPAVHQRHRFAIVLTEPTKVGGFVALLRKSTHGQQLLIGSISENQWLVPVLDVIVATPEEAIEYQRHGCFTSATLKALLIDRSSSSSLQIEQGFKLAASFSGFEGYHGYLEKPPPYRWYSNPELVPASPAILEIISGSSETWDCNAYISALGVFAWGSNKVAVHEFGDVPVFLPGIIRGSLARNSPPLILAPRKKLDQITKLLQATAAELGLPDLSVGKRDAEVLLDCPEELMVPHCLERLLVIEADTLLETSSGWKIKGLVGNCSNCPVGIQFSCRTKAVEELLEHSKPAFILLPQPKVTMENVYQFYSLVDNHDEKLARVCDIFRSLDKKLNLVIFCDSSSTVLRVTEGMKSRGFSAWSFYRGRSDDDHHHHHQQLRQQELEVDPEFYNDPSAILVTNIHRRTGFIDLIINFDLPGSLSLQEYVDRVGHDRSTGFQIKVVINIVTPDEHGMFPAEFPLLAELPEDCSGIHQRLPSFFPGVSPTIIS